MACGCNNRQTGENSKYNYRHLLLINIIQPYELSKLYWHFDKNPNFDWKEWNKMKKEWYDLIDNYLSNHTIIGKMKTFKIIIDQFKNNIECRKDVCTIQKDKHKRYIVDCWIATYPDIGPTKLKGKKIE